MGTRTITLFLALASTFFSAGAQTSMGASAGQPEYISDVQQIGNGLQFNGQGSAFTGFVNMAPFLDDTDISNVSAGFDAVTNLLSIGVTEDGVTQTGSVDLSALDNHFVLQNFSISGNVLTFAYELSQDGVPLSQSVNLTPYLDNTDSQTLLFNNGQLSITGGNTVTIPDNVDDADNDPNNEKQTLTVTKLPVYEYRDIWAEEGGGANANNSEWSFGNGATGFMGLPIGQGWEVTGMYFHADTYAATATIQVDLMNYGNTPSNAGANTIASISLSSSTDGGGATNNGYKYETYATPIPVPVTGTHTVIGFITRGQTGNISDMRVGARLRRQVGEYVSEVTISS